MNFAAVIAVAATCLATEASAQSRALSVAQAIVDAAVTVCPRVYRASALFQAKQLDKSQAVADVLAGSPWREIDVPADMFRFRRDANIATAEANLAADATGHGYLGLSIGSSPECQIVSYDSPKANDEVINLLRARRDLKAIRNIPAVTSVTTFAQPSESPKVALAITVYSLAANDGTKAPFVSVTTISRDVFDKGEFDTRHP